MTSQLFRAIISASIRAYYGAELSKTTDITPILWKIAMWTLGEINFGIMVACLPAGGAFFRHLCQNSLFSAVSKYARELVSCRRKSHRQDEPGYSLEEGKYIDPSLGSQEKRESKRGVSWVKSYGVPGLDTLTSVNEPRMEKNTGSGQSGCHVSVQHHENDEERSRESQEVTEV
jgi:hypothetical protein